ncbi:MAG: hypothetical protein ACFBSF_18180 [Leptolyngbyaceae cyanobacterium]
MDIKQRNRVLLFLCFYFASITGGFFALPGLSLWVGLSGLAIAVFYAGAVCLFQRKATYFATGITILLAVISPSINSMLTRYLVAMTISINVWVLGEMGIALLKHMDRQRAFFQLAGLSVGFLGLGWLWVSFLGW